MITRKKTLEPKDGTGNQECEVAGKEWVETVHHNGKHFNNARATKSAIVVHCPNLLTPTRIATEGFHISCSLAMVLSAACSPWESEDHHRYVVWGLRANKPVATRLS